MTRRSPMAAMPAAGVVALASGKRNAKTQRLWDPVFLAVHQDFWTSAYQAIDD